MLHNKIEVAFAFLTTISLVVKVATSFCGGGSIGLGRMGGAALSNP
jgi:hypothetical protein